MKDDILIEKAIQAAKNAYVPYSHFPVGCAVLLKNNQVILGCNIENASYGLTNCAERTALFQTYSQGFSKEDVVKIAVVGDVQGVISPCGACRQVLLELVKKDCPIILSNFSKTPQKKTSPAELLPLGFTL